MLNYSVREMLAYLQKIDNATQETRQAFSRLLPRGEAPVTDERVVWKAILEIEGALETAREAARRLAVDHGQADLVWKD